ncbi:MAG TPA: dicarboxylate/amino acid:cation symporter [Planctomycetota bacterium]|nr:dicarboxylate/amino acid:cation symporter [Planctomycetota bacterium]
MTEPPREGRRPPVFAILGALALGAVAGLAANQAGPTAGLDGFAANVADPAGRIFLRLIFMLVIPIVFSALVLGIAGFPDLQSLGRVGLKTLLYTVLASSLAVLLGLLVVNLVEPGSGLPAEARENLLAIAREKGRSFAETTPPAGVDLLVSIVPDNPIGAAARGDMLAVIFFALAFGVALASVGAERGRPLLELFEGVFAVSMRLISWAMWVAPIGVFGLVFTVVYRLGVPILLSLLSFVAVVLGALAFHNFVTYSLLLRSLAGVSPGRFFRAVREVMLTAFVTSSSNATLPTALRVSEKNLQAPPGISRFVLTVGATGNQNGTALYEGITVLFLAQLFLGKSLPLGSQLLVLVLAILAGIGTAGVPSGSLPFIAMILGIVGVPPWGVGVIVGVDRILDMCRTVLNVTGDLVAVAVVAKSEGTPVLQGRAGPEPGAA